MHGRPRRAPKPEEEAASAAKAEKLRSIQCQFLSNHHNKIYSKDAVELSAKLLEINPEAYTAWNYRKLAVEHNLSQAESNPGLVKSILDEELRVVESALRQNLKSYGAWHHRKWVLSKGHSSIDNELRLLDKLKRVDSRNFHAWNYRRFVVELMKRSELDELKYTEDMIANNFSNYSAWHNRSVLLSNLLEKKVEGFLSSEKVPEECEYVHQAIFTDSDDQSGWFYHLWLLDQTVRAKSPFLASSWPTCGSRLTLSGVKCLNSSASSFSTFCSDSGSLPLSLYFSQAVHGVNSSTVTVESEFRANEDLVWKPLSMTNSQTSHVWVSELNLSDLEICSSKEYSVKVSLGHSPGIVSCRGFNFTPPLQFTFTVRVCPVEGVSAEGLATDIFSWKDENFSTLVTQSEELDLLVSFNQLSIKNDREPTDSDWRLATIMKEIECFRELLALEDSKIGKLTLARLLTAHDAMKSADAEKLDNSKEVLQLYDDLMKLDPSHYNYYADERSLALLRQVTLNRESVLRHLFCYKDSCNALCLRLNNLSLSRIGSVERLLWVQMLDLSRNGLRSTEGLEAMQRLSSLNLSHNKFSSFSALYSLRHLKLLKVLDISHNQIGEHSVDTTRHLCSSPLTNSVGNVWLHDEVIRGGNSLPDYWDAFFTFRELNLEQLDVVGNAAADEKFRSFVVMVLPKLVWLDGQKLR